MSSVYRMLAAFALAVFSVQTIAAALPNLGDCVGGSFGQRDFLKKCDDKDFCASPVGVCEAIPGGFFIEGFGTAVGKETVDRIKTGSCTNQAYFLGCKTCSGEVVCAHVKFWDVVLLQPDGSLVCRGNFIVAAQQEGDCV